MLLVQLSKCNAESTVIDCKLNRFQEVDHQPFPAAVTVGSQQYHDVATKFSLTLAVARSFLVASLYAVVPAFSFARASYSSSASSTPTISHYFFHTEGVRVVLDNQSKDMRHHYQDDKHVKHQGRRQHSTDENAVFVKIWLTGKSLPVPSKCFVETL